MRRIRSFAVVLAASASPRSHAALQWLATAGAQASTAAMHRPFQLKSSCPTA